MLPFIFGLPTYTICSACGAAAGCALFLLRMPKQERKRAAYLLCAAAPGAVIGAKSLYLLALPEGMTPGPVLSGFVFHGGLIGGAAAGLIAAKRLRLKTLAAMDAAAPALCIGHGIGRIGCFCVGCCYGMELASGGRLPVQLMEAAGLFLLGGYLLRKVQPAREDGGTAARYCLLYGALRFALEFLRGDEVRGAAGGLSTGQWLSLVLMLAGIMLLARTSRIVLMLQNMHLTIDNRLLGGMVPIRFEAWIERTESGRAKLRLRLAGKELSVGGSRRTQFHFLDALPELPLHVRLFHARVILGMPDDAALLAQLSGALRAALNTAGAYLSAREERMPDLCLRVETDEKQARFTVQARLVIAFCTTDALRAVLRTLRRQKHRDG